MKRFSALFLASVLLVTALFTGCSDSSSGKKSGSLKSKDKETEEEEIDETEETEETEAEVTEETEPSETEADVEEIYQIDDVYDNMIYNYVSCINDFRDEPSSVPDEDMWYYDGIISNNAIDFACLHGYTKMDINNDGIDELFILENISYYDESVYQVSALYTIVDGSAVEVFSGWYRNSYIYLGGSDFFNAASAGAASSSFGQFRLNDTLDSFEWSSFYFTDLNEDFTDVVLYYNETGEWDVSTSEEVDIDSYETAYYSYKDSYYDFKDITTFAEFADENGIDIVAEPIEIDIWESDPEYYSGDIIYYTPDINIDYATYLYICNNSVIYDLELLYFYNVEINDDGTISFDIDNCGTVDVVYPYYGPLYAVNFNEYLPTVGIKYCDYYGNEYYYIIEVSGEDGSYSLTPFEVE